VDDCWKYSSNPGRNHIFNNMLKIILNNPNNININIQDLQFSNEEQLQVTREQTFYNNNKYKYNNVCESLGKPSSYRINGPNNEENNQIANLTKNIKNKIGLGGYSRGSLAELAAARIPNNMLLDPPPDRLNLTDDAGPSVYQRGSVARGSFATREGIEITEAL
jgi:hypothetical protein